jgi:NADPH:quinone reductase
VQAIRQRAFGGPEELRMEDVEDPHPHEGQVRIRVAAAGVHVLDTVIAAVCPAAPCPCHGLP